MKVKKITIISLVVCLLVSILSVSASALTYSKTPYSSFNNDWQNQVQYYDEYGSVIGVLLYGFDTDFLNEDYSHTRGYLHYSSQAGVKRGSDDTQWGAEAISGYLSTKNVYHNTDTVKYYIKLS